MAASATALNAVLKSILNMSHVGHVAPIAMYSVNFCSFQAAAAPPVIKERAKATFLVSMSYVAVLTAKYKSQLDINCFAFALSPRKSGGALIFTSPVPVVAVVEAIRNRGPGGGGGGWGSGWGVIEGVRCGDPPFGSLGSGEGVKGGKDPSNSLKEGPDSVVVEVGLDGVSFCFPFWGTGCLRDEGGVLCGGFGRNWGSTSPSNR
jgi:hypothetical protein